MNLKRIVPTVVALIALVGALASCSVSQRLNCGDHLRSVGVPIGQIETTDGIKATLTQQTVYSNYSGRDFQKSATLTATLPASISVQGVIINGVDGDWWFSPAPDQNSTSVTITVTRQGSNDSFNNTVQGITLCVVPVANR